MFLIMYCCFLSLLLFVETGISLQVDYIFEKCTSEKLLDAKKKKDKDSIKAGDRLYFFLPLKMNHHILRFVLNAQLFAYFELSLMFIVNASILCTRPVLENMPSPPCRQYTFTFFVCLFVF